MATLIVVDADEILVFNEDGDVIERLPGDVDLDAIATHYADQGPTEVLNIGAEADDDLAFELKGDR